MKVKKLLAAILCIVLLALCTSCGTPKPASTTTAFKNPYGTNDDGAIADDIFDDLLPGLGN